MKVLDFGLAKLSEQISEEEAPTASIRVKTEEGAIVGSAAYMSPEQAEGRTVDARSDIFSFGAVLYEMFSGRRAFSGVLREEPKPIEDIPPEFERIVRRCLRWDPDKRFHHMDDVKVAATAWCSQDARSIWTSGGWNFQDLAE